MPVAVKFEVVVKSKRPPVALIAPPVAEETTRCAVWTSRAEPPLTEPLSSSTVGVARIVTGKVMATVKKVAFPPTHPGSAELIQKKRWHNAISAPICRRSKRVGPAFGSAASNCTRPSVPLENSTLATVPGVSPPTSSALTMPPPTVAAVPAAKLPEAEPCHTRALAVPVQVSQQLVA